MQYEFFFEVVVVVVQAPINDITAINDIIIIIEPTRRFFGTNLTEILK